LPECCGGWKERGDWASGRDGSAPCLLLSSRSDSCSVGGRGTGWLGSFCRSFLRVFSALMGSGVCGRHFLGETSAGCGKTSSKRRLGRAAGKLPGNWLESGEALGRQAGLSSAGGCARGLACWGEALSSGATPLQPGTAWGRLVSMRR